MVTLPGGRFWSFWRCAAVLGVMTLKPAATSMLSLFCVLVCVLAQPALSTVHVAATAVRKIYFDGFISCNLIVANCVSIKCSKSNASGNLRAVQNSIKTKTVILIGTSKGAITDLSKDGTR